MISTTEYHLLAGRDSGRQDFMNQNFDVAEGYRVADQLVASFAAVREFESLLAPSLSLSVRNLDPSDHKYAAGFRLVMREVIPDGLPSMEPLLPDLPESADREFPGRIVVDMKDGPDGQRSGGVGVEFDDPRDNARFNEVQQRMFAPLRHQHRLYDSVIVLVASAVEVFYGDFYKLHLMAFRGAIKSESKIDLSVVRQAESLEDLWGRIVSRDVRRLMAGQVSEWRAEVHRQLGVPGQIVPTEYGLMLEQLFLRRNAILHSASKVTEDYARFWRRHRGTDIQVGSVLATQRGEHNKYVEAGLVDGLASAYLVLAKHDERRSHAAGWVTNHILELISDDRFAAARDLSQVIESDDRAADLDRKIAAVNRLQAEKWMGNQPVVEGYFEANDWSATTPKLQFGRLILLNKLDEASALAKRAIAAGDMSAGEVKLWPLLREARDHEVFSWLHADPEGTSSDE